MVSSESGLVAAILAVFCYASAGLAVETQDHFDVDLEPFRVPDLPDGAAAEYQFNESGDWRSIDEIIYWGPDLSTVLKAGYRLAGDESTEVVYDAIEGGRDAGLSINYEYTPNGNHVTIWSVIRTQLVANYDPNAAKTKNASVAKRDIYDEGELQTLPYNEQALRLYKEMD